MSTKTKESLFEDKPRWKGAPRVCVYSNSMAFRDMDAINKFLDANAPHGIIEKVWKCEKCGLLHFLCFPRCPSQDGQRSRTKPEQISRMYPFKGERTR